MIKVHLLVVNPTQQQRETAKAHAAAARKPFFFGGLLHDCLMLSASTSQMIYLYLSIM